MGRYDDITADELRGQLLRFTRLVRAMEKRGVLLEKAPSLLRLLGELRQMIFAYEVRSTRALPPAGKDPGKRSGPEEESGDGDTDPTARESSRIVQEARERERELQEELRNGLLREDGDDD